MENHVSSVDQELIQHGTCLLTVIVRTTGNRYESLEEVLLCLSGQTSSAFEVIVVTHNANQHQLDSANELVEWAKLNLRLKIRLVSCEFGARGQPLNLGMAEANGCLIAFLDDDDHVLNHWVETFLTGHSIEPRKVVRVRTARRETRLNAMGSHISWGKALTPAFARFSWLTHYSANQTPIHGFAIPKLASSLHDIEFDPMLPVVEDWDLLMRASLSLGVFDLDEITGIYNRQSAEAMSGESRESWRDAEILVRTRLSALLEESLQAGEMPNGLSNDALNWLTGKNVVESEPPLHSRRVKLVRFYLRNERILRPLAPHGSVRRQVLKRLANSAQLP